MRPRCVITVNGTPVAGLFWEKLIRVEVSDREGSRSDSISLELEDGPPHLAIPEPESIIRCWLGYDDGPFDYMGAFKVDDVDVDVLPYMMKIKGTAADLKEGLKEHRERHWDGKTLNDVFGEIASQNGLQAQIAPSIGSFQYPWLAQQSESALHFVNRIAERHNGLFAIKDGKLIVSELGTGLSPGGAAISSLTVTPDMILQGTCSVSFGQREKHGNVSGEYHDIATGERKRESEQGEGSSAGYVRRHGLSSKEEAKAAAKSRGKYLKRGGVRTAVQIEGNPYAKAGAPMSYAGVRPGVDGISFIIEEARHVFSKSQGYRTSLNAKVKS
ncbi:phage late control D family protein [Leptospira interrogans]